jgi:WD40 repeat protein
MTMNDMNSFNARVALRQHGNDYAKSTKYMNTSGFFSPENIPNICVREINSRDRITCMVCVGEGKYMVTGHYSDGLKVWDLQTQKQVRHFGNAYDSERVLNVNLLSPTSPLIIVASAFQKGFSIWNWMTGKLYDEITHNCAIVSEYYNLTFIDVR